MDLVSIITPSYNCGKFIVETIRSVQAQTYSDWELIIIDDCSTDNTLEILKPIVESDNRIQVYSNDTNSGAAVSRNLGLRMAKGEWIAFLDSDDIWLPTKLERQLKFMKEEKCFFSYHNYEEMNESAESLGLFVTGPSVINRIGMYAFCWPGCLTVMYNRNRIGLIQIPDIKKNNDYAIWLRAVKKENCYLLNENLARYRRARRGSISSQNLFTLIKWHYKLFHDSEKMPSILAMALTLVNIVCGAYKKMFMLNLFDENEFKVHHKVDF